MVPPAPTSEVTTGVTTGYTQAGFIVAYNVLEIFAVFILTAVLATAWLSPTVKRSSCWFFVIGCSLFDSLAGLLIIGKQAGHGPGRFICSIQAIIIYPATIL